MINKMIHNYQIEEKIGEGGMGTVYKGTDVNLQRPVAIKILHAHLLSDPLVIERFRAEARMLANLNHANLATLYNFLSFEDSYCMVMEYVEGKTLAQILASEEKISPLQALEYTKQILDGLAHAHRHKVIHRDIKPSNIIITTSGIVKVMDFGIARIIGSQRFTRTGMMIGTLQYMAPEQIRGEEGEAAADIYATGTVLYEMLSRQLPYTSNTEFELIQQKVSTSAIDINTIAKLPVAWSKTIMKSLEKESSHRFNSAIDFRTAIAGLTQAEDPLESITHAPSSGKFNSRNITLASTLIILILTTIWLIMPKSEVPFDASTDGTTVASGISFHPENTSIDMIADRDEPSFERATRFEITLPEHANVDSLFAIAQSHFLQAIWMSATKDDALTLCKKILEIAPDHAGAISLLRQMAKTLETKGDSLQTIGALQEAIFSYEQSLQCSWSETVNMKKNHLLLNLNTKIKLPETQKIHKPLRIKAPIKKDIPKIDPNNVATDSAAENATSKNIQDIQETSVKKIESTGEDTLKSDLRETNREKPSNEHKKVYRYMPSGTVVNLMLEETVSSESHVAGSRVAFTIQKDITIKGEVVIQKGSKATAKISAAKSLRDYSKAILEIEIQSIQATNGERILLKANTFRIVGKRNEAAQILRGQLFEVRTQTDHTLYFQ